MTTVTVGATTVTEGQPITGSNGGTFIVNADGTYTFAPGLDFNGLAVGETATTQVTYTISDGNGGTASTTLEVTITGENDAPTATAVLDTSSNDSAPASYDVSAHFSDADATDVLGYAVSGLPAGFAIDATGVITGTWASNASQGGPASDGVYPVTVTVSDGHGGTVSRTFNWTVVNPAPVAVDDAATTNEDTSAVGDVTPGTLGQDSDPDGDALNVTPQAGVAGSNGGTFTILGNGNYTFNPGSDFQDLGPGDSRTTEITYTLTDADGAAATAVVRVTVTGINDAPTVTGVVPAQSSTDTQNIAAIDVTGVFADIEADTLTYSASGLPLGLSIDPNTGLITGTIDNDASGPSGAQTYTVTVTALDQNGASVSTSFSWMVANPALIAANDAVSTSENATLAGDVFADNGNGPDSDPDGDAFAVVSVTSGATTYAPAASVPGTGGGTFVIAADGSFTFDPGTDFDNLAVGATATTTVAYTIRDANGAEATATVSVTVNGTNDGPVAVGTLPAVTSSDSDTVDIDTSGAFGDLDDGTVFTYALLGVAGIDYPAGLTIDANGHIVGTIDSEASQNGPYSVIVQASDGVGGVVTQPFTWVVVNPIPDARNDGFALSEGASLTGAQVLADNGGGADNDPDGDTLAVVAVNGAALGVGAGVTGSNGGTFTIAADGTTDFAPGAAFEDLAVGETRTTSVTYTLSDGNGGADTATVTVTVTGVNDLPVSTPVGAQSGIDGQAVTLDVSGSFTDPDGDTLTFSATGLPPGLTINPATGIIGGTVASNASLAGPYSVTIVANDGNGGTTSQTFVWTVTNPAPVAQDDGIATSENAVATGNVLASNGNGPDSDPDGDALTVVAVNGTAFAGTTTATGTAGGTFTIAANGAVSFDPGAAFDDLAVGQTRVTQVTYTISDGQGGTDTATVSVTVTGANDAPVAGPLANVTSNDGDTVSISIGGTFTDSNGDTLSFTATGLPPGLTIDPATGVISGTIDTSASAGGPYSVVVTASDGNGGTVSQTFGWTVSNPLPTAQNDLVTTGENTIVTGSVLTDNGLGADSDPDGDAVAVWAVNGVPGSVGLPVTGSAGGTFTIGADGSYRFEPGTAFDDLQSGETRLTAVTYTIRDADGGVSTATVTVTVTGVADVPVIDPIVPPVSVDSGVIDFDVSVHVDDPDGDPLSYSATGLPPGLTIDPATGRITGTLPPDASQGGPYAVTLTVDDGHGGVVTSTFIWPVTNPPPVAIDDTSATPAGLPVRIPVLSNDRDPDGDPLTITAASAGHGTVAINADGTIDYTPDPSFEGMERIAYTISDGNGGFATAYISIYVEPRALVLLGEVFGFEGPERTPDPVEPEGVIEGMSADGAVVQAVADFGGLSSLAASISEDGIIVQTTNGVRSLGGIGRFTGERGTIIGETVGNARQFDFSRSPSVARGGTTGELEGLTGFSLRSEIRGNLTGFSGGEQLVIESLVRDDVLNLQFSNTVTQGQRQIVEYRVTQIDGRPVPGWLERVGGDLMLGERPADVETIELRVEGRFNDGTIVVQEVSIHAVTGEIQPLRQSGGNAPALFRDQFRASPMLTPSELEGLGATIAR